MWLIAIRNFDIYIYIYIYFKCYQRRNYQINGDIYILNAINVEIIKLIEIHTFLG